MAIIESPVVAQPDETVAKPAASIDDLETRPSRAPLEIAPGMRTDPLTFSEVFRGEVEKQPARTAATANFRPLLEPTLEEFQQALARREFQLLYQPQFDAREGHLVGAEALIRWNHPVHGRLLPRDFLGAAERNGFVVDFGIWTFSRVADLCSRLMERPNGFNGRISVNMSPVHLNQDAAMSGLIDACVKLNIPLQYMEIELTETGFLDNISRAQRLLVRLRELGASIALDDFGRGTSSIELAARLPITTLKLDMSFVQRLETAELDRVIVRRMLEFCVERGLRSIAEGVETESQASLLTAWGCDCLQGNFFSGAVDEKSLLKML
jgi:EAL domain-containing protein (putative c-di-GMP-specific phosphodiesterase class I)